MMQEILDLLNVPFRDLQKIWELLKFSPKIRHLILSSSCDFKSDQTFPNIQILQLTGNMNISVNLPNLSVLHVVKTGSPEAQTLISRNDNVRYLIVEGIGFDQQSFTSFKNLKCLIIKKNQSKDEFFPIINEVHPNLEILRYIRSFDLSDSSACEPLKFPASLISNTSKSSIFKSTLPLHSSRSIVLISSNFDSGLTAR